MRKKPGKKITAREEISITRRQVLATKALDRIGDILKEQGVSLDELITAGGQIRAALSKRRFQ